MSMRRALVFALLLSCSSNDDANVGASPSPDSGVTPAPDPSVESDAGGGDASSSFPLVAARPYRTKVPAKYDASKGTPLVVLLHGYGATAKVQDDYFKMSALADAETFLLALPDGTVDSGGKRFWSATNACCDFAGAKIDDIGYLTEVIHDMKARYNVDAKRVYLVGHSNGGFMANALACALAQEIAAIVSLAGANHGDVSLCKPTEPVAVLQVHGDNDAVVKYGGGTLFTGGATYPSAKDTVASWAGKNGCDASLSTTNDKLDLESTLAGSETSVARHTCAKGAAELWTIAGGAHVPTFQPTWAKTIYDFLAAHPKP
jgi:polyhydroxybutyrate depolymerase